MISLPFLQKKDEEFDFEMQKLFDAIIKHSSFLDFSVLKKISYFLKREEFNLIKKAYRLSALKHKEQKRISGEPYFTHLFQTALFLAEYGADTETIVAALLHDILEDTKIKTSEIKQIFGERVYNLVKGVTKLSKISTNARESYLKKMFVVSATDVRVLVIKLADKLHNMRTIEFLPEEKRKRIAEEALKVYVPLAHKLGLHELEHEMQEICFKELMPEKFAELKKQMEPLYEAKRKELEVAIETLKKQLKFEKKNYSFEFFKKDLYAIYRKLSPSKSLNQMYDFYTLIILTDNTRECYNALGLLYSIFKPIPGKFKDLIALPTMPTYQSIHTAVIGPNGNPIKVYIRTKEMHELARKGIACFFTNKKKLDEYNKYWKKISSIAKKASIEEVDFLDVLKSDILCVDIDVYHNGVHYKMPCNSTVLDFAYTIFPNKAAFLKEAKLNNIEVSFSEKLFNGSSLNFYFSDKPTIKKEWLSQVILFDSKKKIAHDLRTIKNN